MKKISLMLLVLALVLCSCGSKDISKEIVGDWSYTDNETTYILSNGSLDWDSEDSFDDNVKLAGNEGLSSYDGDRTWQITDGYLYIHKSRQNDIYYNITIDGDIMTLSVKGDDDEKTWYKVY